MSYSNSDRLAIALTCLAGAMAIILVLVEKTPATVVGLLLLMLSLLVYPILHFAKRTGSRAAAFVACIIGTLLLGWLYAWPHDHLISANGKYQEPQQQAKPEEKKDEKKGQDTKKQEPRPKKVDKPNPEIKTGNIEQGPCSNLQIGSSGTQTVNCGPIPPQLALTTLKESVKVAENLYETEFRLTIKSEQTIPYLFLKAEAPTITDRISLVPEGLNGAFAAMQRMKRSGPGYLSTNYEGMAAGVYVITISCTQPDKVTLTYDPKLHN